jgi:hypothetical protein
MDKTVTNILGENISDAEYARNARKQMDALTGLRIVSWDTQEYEGQLFDNAALQRDVAPMQAGEKSSALRRGRPGRAGRRV